MSFSGSQRDLSAKIQTTSGLAKRCCHSSDRFRKGKLSVGKGLVFESRSSLATWQKPWQQHRLATKYVQGESGAFTTDGRRKSSVGRVLGVECSASMSRGARWLGRSHFENQIVDRIATADYGRRVDVVCWRRTAVLGSIAWAVIGFPTTQIWRFS